jgi:predicted NUDIX family phosphoesterase
MSIQGKKLSVQPVPPVYDEHILVVKRTALFGSQGEAWQGIKKVDFVSYLELITAHQEFLPRSRMEIDPTYKQIIPYLVFKYQDSYFLMQRKAKASETRLQSKFTLGIGGHIRQEDLQEGSTLFDWARREFHEEVTYRGSLKITSLGILNDDSNAVGQVHIGFVLLLEGNSGDIKVQEELESGTLVTLQECALYRDRLESWSITVFDELISLY